MLLQRTAIALENMYGVAKAEIEAVRCAAGVVVDNWKVERNRERKQQIKTGIHTGVNCI